MGRSAEIRVARPTIGSSSALALFCASFGRLSRFALTRLLRSQQLSPDRAEVCQRGVDLEPVQVLGEPAVTDFLEAEHPLDHPDRVLDLRADPRLGAVRGFDTLIDPAAGRPPASPPFG